MAQASWIESLLPASQVTGFDFLVTTGIGGNIVLKSIPEDELYFEQQGRGPFLDQLARIISPEYRDLPDRDRPDLAEQKRIRKWSSSSSRSRDNADATSTASAPSSSTCSSSSNIAASSSEGGEDGSDVLGGSMTIKSGGGGASGPRRCGGPSSSHEGAVGSSRRRRQKQVLSEWELNNKKRRGVSTPGQLFISVGGVSSTGTGTAGGGGATTERFPVSPHLHSETQHSDRRALVTNSPHRRNTRTGSRGERGFFSQQRHQHYLKVFGGPRGQASALGRGAGGEPMLPQRAVKFHSTHYLYRTPQECFGRNFAKASSLALFTILSGAVAARTAEVGLSAALRRPRYFMTRDLLQNGTTFGLLISGYNTILFLISKHSAYTRGRWAWLAGLLSGLSVVVAPPEGQHWAVVFTTTRVAEIFAIILQKNSAHCSVGVRNFFDCVLRFFTRALLRLANPIKSRSSSLKPSIISDSDVPWPLPGSNIPPTAQALASSVDSKSVTTAGPTKSNSSARATVLDGKKKHQLLFDISGKNVDAKKDPEKVEQEEDHAGVDDVSRSSSSDDGVSSLVSIPELAGHERRSSSPAAGITTTSTTTGGGEIGGRMVTSYSATNLDKSIEARSTVSAARDNPTGGPPSNPARNATPSQTLLVDLAGHTTRRRSASPVPSRRRSRSLSDVIRTREAEGREPPSHVRQSPEGEEMDSDSRHRGLLANASYAFASLGEATSTSSLKNKPGDSTLSSAHSSSNSLDQIRNLSLSFGAGALGLARTRPSSQSPTSSGALVETSTGKNVIHPEFPSSGSVSLSGDTSSSTTSFVLKSDFMLTFLGVWRVVYCTVHRRTALDRGLRQMLAGEFTPFASEETRIFDAPVWQKARVEFLQRHGYNLDRISRAVAQHLLGSYMRGFYRFGLGYVLPKLFVQLVYRAASAARKHFIPPPEWHEDDATAEHENGTASTDQLSEQESGSDCATSSSAVVPPRTRTTANNYAINFDRMSRNNQTKGANAGFDERDADKRATKPTSGESDDRGGVRLHGETSSLDTSSVVSPVVASDQARLSGRFTAYLSFLREAFRDNVIPVHESAFAYAALFGMGFLMYLVAPRTSIFLQDIEGGRRSFPALHRLLRRLPIAVRTSVVAFFLSTATRLIRDPLRRAEIGLSLFACAIHTFLSGERRLGVRANTSAFAVSWAILCHFYANPGPLPRSLRSSMSEAGPSSDQSKSSVEQVAVASQDSSPEDATSSRGATATSIINAPTSSTPCPDENDTDDKWSRSTKTPTEKQQEANSTVAASNGGGGGANSSEGSSNPSYSAPSSATPFVDVTKRIGEMLRKIDISPSGDCLPIRMRGALQYLLDGRAMRHTPLVRLQFKV